MATHSGIRAWDIPWTEEPGRPHPWGCKESDSTERLHYYYYYILFKSVVLATSMLLTSGILLLAMGFQ